MQARLAGGGDRQPLILARSIASCLNAFGKALRVALIRHASPAQKATLGVRRNEARSDVFAILRVSPEPGAKLTPLLASWPGVDYQESMPSKHTLRAVKALRIYCPLEAKTLDALLAGETAALEQDAALSRMLVIIRRDNPLGDFGIYKSVVEIAPGWELFRPSVEARPTVGQAEENAASPTAILTIYIPSEAPAKVVADAIDALLEAHPWEVPVVEVYETQLVCRR